MYAKYNDPDPVQLCTPMLKDIHYINQSNVYSLLPLPLLGIVLGVHS